MVELSFVKEGWIPNYVTFKETVLKKSGDAFQDWFLNYIEAYVKPYIKDNNNFYFSFDFGEKKIELPYNDLLDLLFKFKIYEESPYINEKRLPKELADFFGYFNLIEKAKEGYYMVEDSVRKLGQASFATLLGHVMVEKNILKVK